MAHLRFAPLARSLGRSLFSGGAVPRVGAKAFGPRTRAGLLTLVGLGLGASLSTLHAEAPEPLKSVSPGIGSLFLSP
jgi:hypothetical protein